ncbi:hypothetical protein KIN20_028538 [Parelaphostrongylus tenuis]|uniref:Uncharacterized protein n=1 Tax=Parelaphostrongylus tenuis TaxID=148309 RepID=A0AAD5WEW7_PARTN|nr:hypothetical protein KIN20_028538 [Parelaphostrongylus tenuis]
MQLKQKGELIDGTILQQLLIEKLTKDIQRHVIQERRQREGTWLTEEMLASINEYIKEKLNFKSKCTKKSTTDMMPGTEMMEILRKPIQVNRKYYEENRVSIAKGRALTKGLTQRTIPRRGIKRHGPCGWTNQDESKSSTLSQSIQATIQLSLKLECF